MPRTNTVLKDTSNLNEHITVQGGTVPFNKLSNPGSKSCLAEQELNILLKQVKSAGLADETYNLLKLLVDDHNEMKADLVDTKSQLKKLKAKHRKLNIKYDRLKLGHKKIEGKLKISEAEREKWKDLSERDALTEVYNRRGFNNHLNEKIGLASRSGKPLTVLFIDVDKFKFYNDTHGHIAGDAVLVHVASAITNSLRGTDMVARFGGDEFVVVSPSASKEIVNDLIKRIKMAIETSFECKNKNGHKINLTPKSSIGAATIENIEINNKDDLKNYHEQITNIADKAMYKEKNK